MIKHKLFYIIFFFLIFTLSISAQVQNSLKLYAIVGGQVNKFNFQFNTDLSPQIYSFSLGAGSEYYMNRLKIGTEFYFSNATNSNSNFKVDYSGMNSSLFIGYNILKNRKLLLEPALGFSFLNNKSIISNKILFQNQYYSNNQLGLTPSLSISKINSSGIFYGLKAGYNFSFNANSFWKDENIEANSVLNDNIGSFFIHFTMGSLLNFSKKKS